MDEQQLFAIIRQIAAIPFEFQRESAADKDEIGISDQRSELGNPYFGQTVQGVFVIATRTNALQSIYTPIGEWSPWGSQWGDYRTVLADILKRYGADINAPVEGELASATRMYAVTCVDGVDLPTAIYKERPYQFDVDEMRAKWLLLVNGTE